MSAGLPSIAVNAILERMDEFLKGENHVAYEEGEYVVVRSLRWHIAAAEGSLEWFEQGWRIHQHPSYKAGIDRCNEWLAVARELESAYTAAQGVS